MVYNALILGSNKHKTLFPLINIINYTPTGTSTFNRCKTLNIALYQYLTESPVPLTICLCSGVKMTRCKWLQSPLKWVHCWSKINTLLFSLPSVPFFPESCSLRSFSSLSLFALPLSLCLPSPRWALDVTFWSSFWIPPLLLQPPFSPFCNIQCG